MSYYFKPTLCTSNKKFAIKEGVFTPEECQKIRDLFVNPIVASVTEKSEVNESQRKSKVVWLYPTPEKIWIYQKLEEVVIDCNRHHWNFQLTGFLEALQLTEYVEGGHYSWHEDLGPGSHSTRKLSVVVQLSDPSEYEGGDFVIFPDHKASRLQGSVTVFPSHATHKASSVRSGKRMSLVVWTSGPSLI